MAAVAAAGAELMEASDALRRMFENTERATTLVRVLPASGTAKAPPRLLGALSVRVGAAAAAASTPEPELSAGRGSAAAAADGADSLQWVGCGKLPAFTRFGDVLLYDSDGSCCARPSKLGRLTRSPRDVASGDVAAVARLLLSGGTAQRVWVLQGGAFAVAALCPATVAKIFTDRHRCGDAEWRQYEEPRMANRHVAEVLPGFLFLGDINSRVRPGLRRRAPPRPSSRMPPARPSLCSASAPLYFPSQDPASPTGRGLSF